MSDSKDPRARQIEVLRALAERLSEGEDPLPIDVFDPIERELELRLDEAALTDAWTTPEEAESEGEPWSRVKPRLHG